MANEKHYDKYDLTSETDIRCMIREEAMELMKAEFGKKILREFLFSKETIEALYTIINKRPFHIEKNQLEDEIKRILENCNIPDLDMVRSIIKEELEEGNNK